MLRRALVSLALVGLTGCGDGFQPNETPVLTGGGGSAAPGGGGGETSVGGSIDAGGSGGGAGAGGASSGGEGVSGAVSNPGGSGGTPAGGSSGAGGTEPVAGSSGAAGTGGSCAEPCVYYADADGDGFGNPEVTMEHCGDCSVPDGYSSNGDDCYDGNAAANPEPYPDSPHEEDRGDGSWDFNCDGDETPQWPDLGYCPDTSTDPVTPGTTGWWYDTVPACGDEGHWKSNAASCPGVLLGVIQQCK